MDTPRGGEQAADPAPPIPLSAPTRPSGGGPPPPPVPPPAGTEPVPATAWSGPAPGYGQPRPQESGGYGAGVPYPHTAHQPWGHHDASFPAAHWPPPGPHPHQPGGRTPVGLWLTAGSSALVALTALVLCVALMAVNLQGGGTVSGKPGRDVLYDRTWFQAAGSVDIDTSAHPVYGLATPAQVSCDIPAFDPASVSGWEDFTEAVGPCLNDMWLPVLQEIGLRPQEPNYVVLDELPDEFRAETGEDGVTLAYYMGHDLSITVLVPSVRKLLPYPNMRDERVWFALLAHEYGHHVQGETGLLDAAYSLERAADSEAAELAVSRRIELQAECFAGIGTAGVREHGVSDVTFVNRNFNEDGGDSDSHGSTANRVHWFFEGARSSTLEGCNTFGADEGLTR